jgi:hypothetical protein
LAIAVSPPDMQALRKFSDFLLRLVWTVAYQLLVRIFLLRRRMEGAKSKPSSGAENP